MKGKKLGKQSQHVRRVRTKNGKKKVVINPGVRAKGVKKRFKVMSAKEYEDSKLNKRIFSDVINDKANDFLAKADKLENSMSFNHSREELLEMADRYKRRGEHLKEVAANMMSSGVDPICVSKPSSSEVLFLKNRADKVLVNKKKISTSSVYSGAPI